MDIATGYLEIGGLLELDSDWQKLDKIRIILGNEMTKRTKEVKFHAKAYITYFRKENLTAAIVAFVVLLAVLVIGAFKTDSRVAWMVNILAFIRLLPDYYYARKYNMDELHSVEELLQKHPEAEPKIRKTVPGE